MSKITVEYVMAGKDVTVSKREPPTSCNCLCTSDVMSPRGSRCGARKRLAEERASRSSGPLQTP